MLLCLIVSHKAAEWERADLLKAGNDKAAIPPRKVQRSLQRFIGKFQHKLPACPAGCRFTALFAAVYGHCRNPPLALRYHGGAGVALRADGQAKARVFHIAPGVNPALSPRMAAPTLK